MNAFQLFSSLREKDTPLNTRKYMWETTAGTMIFFGQEAD